MDTIVANLVIVIPILFTGIGLLIQFVIWLSNSRKRELENNTLESKDDLQAAQRLALIGSSYSTLLDQLQDENNRLRGLEIKVDQLQLSLDTEKIHAQKLTIQVEALMMESDSQGVRLAQLETENIALKLIVEKLRAENKKLHADIKKYRERISDLESGDSKIL